MPTDRGPGRGRPARAWPAPLPAAGPADERRHTETTLRADFARYAALVENASDVILVLEPGTYRVRWTSPSARAVLGFDPSDPDESFTARLHPDDVAPARARLQQVIAGEANPAYDVRVRHSDGGWRVFEGVGANLVDDPVIEGIVVTLRDVTQVRSAHRQLAERAEQLAARVEQQSALAEFGRRALSGEELAVLLAEACHLVLTLLRTDMSAVYRLEPDGRRLRLVTGRGYPRKLVGTALIGVDEPRQTSAALRASSVVMSRDLLDADTGFPDSPGVHRYGARSGVCVIIGDLDNPWGVLSGHSREVRDFSDADVAFLENLAHLVAAAVGRRRAEEEIRHQATHDMLTGLPNRFLLRDQIEQQLAEARRTGEHVGLLLLDLDGFKDVNDSLGHAAGDEVLQVVAGRLSAAVRSSDLVARLGGDEFAVLLTKAQDENAVVAVAGKVLDLVQRPVSVDEVEMALSGSVGVTLSGPGDTSGALLQRADVAMYRAKGARGTWAVYDEGLDRAQARRLAAITDLRRAIEQDELELHVQPIVRVGSGALASVEALVRWRHPRRGLLLPGEFIGLAEQTGLIRPLTAWVLDRAAATAAQWRAAGLDLEVAVNVSGSLLDEDGRFAAELAATAERHGLPARALQVEITESATVHPAQRAALRALADRGIVTAVDDFGTGYSGLAWLKELAVDRLKIDRTFVTTMAEDPRDRAIVRAAVTLAHDLGLLVVAEGVETDAVYALLRSLGVDQAQGWLFGRAVPADELIATFGPRGDAPGQSTTP